MSTLSRPAISFAAMFTFAICVLSISASASYASTLTPDRSFFFASEGNDRSREAVFMAGNMAVVPLAAMTFVNDNWNLVADSDGSNSITVGDVVRNDNDTVNAGVVTATYGIDGFGTVTSGAFTGSSAGTATINDAIANADVGGTVNVLEGTYSEMVSANHAVTLRGAQGGVDARTRVGGAESIVNGAGNNGMSPFNVTASNVTIDGFTVQGATNANIFGFGIVLGSGTAGSEVRNNIIQNNIAGINLANNDGANPSVIERNLFRDNNLPGPISGTAIYTDQFTGGATLSNVIIDSNTFSNNNNAAVLLGSTLAGSQSNVTISNNQMDANGNALMLFNLLNSFVVGNTITGSHGTQIIIGGGVNGLLVRENFIQNGTARGIWVGDFGGGGTNQNITVTRNSITGNPLAGLAIDPAVGSYTGRLDATRNWWGDISGPTIATNPGGTGEIISDPPGVVDYDPWLLQSDPDGDADGDGVINSNDLCSGTVLPEPRPAELKKNRFYADTVGRFVDANNTRSGITVADTHGCSAVQIVAATGIGGVHLQYGVTRGVLADWIASHP